MAKTTAEGSTLIEVTIAVTVLAILSLGVLLGFTTAGTQDRLSYELTRSQNACTSLLEQFEAQDFDVLVGLVENPWPTEVVDKWRLESQIVQLDPDLIAIRCVAQVDADGAYRVELVSLKSRKEEGL